MVIAVILSRAHQKPGARAPPPSPRQLPIPSRYRCSWQGRSYNSVSRKVSAAGCCPPFAARCPWRSGAADAPSWCDPAPRQFHRVTSERSALHPSHSTAPPSSPRSGPRAECRRSYLPTGLPRIPARDPTFPAERPGMDSVRPGSGGIVPSVGGACVGRSSR